MRVSPSDEQPSRLQPRLISAHAQGEERHERGLTEIELSVLSRQCLDRRIPDKATLQTEVRAWATRRNRAGGTVDWQFTTDDARTKLKRLYPSVHE